MADELDITPVGSESTDDVLAQYAEARGRLDAIARNLGYANGFSELLTTSGWATIREFWEFEELRLMRQLATIRKLHLPEQQELAIECRTGIKMIRSFYREPEQIASKTNTDALMKERTKWSEIFQAVSDKILAMVGR